MVARVATGAVEDRKKETLHPRLRRSPHARVRSTTKSTSPIAPSVTAITARHRCGRLDCLHRRHAECFGQQIVELGNAQMVRKRQRRFVQTGRWALCVPVSESMDLRPAQLLLDERT